MVLKFDGTEETDIEIWHCKECTHVYPIDPNGGLGFAYSFAYCILLCILKRAEMNNWVSLKPTTLLSYLCKTKLENGISHLILELSVN